MFRIHGLLLIFFLSIFLVLFSRRLRLSYSLFQFPHFIPCKYQTLSLYLTLSLAAHNIFPFVSVTLISAENFALNKFPHLFTWEWNMSVMFQASFLYSSSIFFSSSSAARFPFHTHFLSSAFNRAYNTQFL